MREQDPFERPRSAEQIGFRNLPARERHARVDLKSGVRKDFDTFRSGGLGMNRGREDRCGGKPY
jgi:hypothetical protein